MHRWSLGMDKYWVGLCDCQSMLGLKLNHVSKRGLMSAMMLLVCYPPNSILLSELRCWYWSSIYQFKMMHFKLCLSSCDIIKWKHFPRYWPFVRGTHRWPVKSPHKVTRSFGVFFDLRLNKRLRKQSYGWWPDSPSRSLWRHCDDKVMVMFDIWKRDPVSVWDLNLVITITMTS